MAVGQKRARGKLIGKKVGRAFKEAERKWKEEEEESAVAEERERRSEAIGGGDPQCGGNGTKPPYNMV
jgi:hypothetical protein